VIAAGAVLCQLVIQFWAQNEFTQPESIVGAQATMLARDGTLYYDLNRYPHTVAAYMPFFYWLSAGLIKLGLPVFLAGRLWSSAAVQASDSGVARARLPCASRTAASWTVSGGSGEGLSGTCFSMFVTKHASY
jgi:hypothetical protein